MVNGVPYLFNSYNKYYSTQGSLIYFKREDAFDAYRIISRSNLLKCIDGI